MIEIPDVKTQKSALNYLGRAFHVYFGGASNNRQAFEMAAFKLCQFIYSRDKRLEDIQSPEVQMAIQIKKSLFPYGVPNFVICMDVRVLAKLIACLHGHSFRTPAGDIKNEFLPKKNRPSELFLNEGNFSKMLDEAFMDQPTIMEIFDSHLNCAAGGLRAADYHAKKALDNGLRDDVVRKKRMKAAAIDYVNRKYGTAKNLFVLQTAFNPSNGFCYLGLDRDDCLSRVASQGYTEDNIRELVKEGLILSTSDLVRSGLIKKLFLKYYFECDYLTDYRQSSFNFWNNIKLMAPRLFPFMEEKVRAVIGPLSENDLKQAAVFLAANAYNAFLHNFQADGLAKKYVYDVHNESVIAVTTSEKGPFDRATSFSLDPNSPSLSSDLVFGHGLIRNNRAAGRMSTYEIEAMRKVFQGDNERYINNPVLTMFFHRTWEELTTQETKELMGVNWSDLADVDWISMTDDEFRRVYLIKKMPGISAVAASAINNLRKQAVHFFQPGLPSSELILDGRIIPVWTLTDPDRKTIAFLPFLINGY